jgi:hypothetical protein
MITEEDEIGGRHPGFANAVHLHLAEIASTPTGNLLYRLVYWGFHEIRIRPGITGSPIHGGARTKIHDGGIVIITLDPDLTDHDIKVFDHRGRSLDMPVYLLLAHELVHAYRIVSGLFINDPRSPPKEDMYIHRDEELTITSKHLSENRIRKERKLRLRHGSLGIDLRPGALQLPSDVHP